MVSLCVRHSPITKVTLVRLPDRAICVLSCALVLCCAMGVIQTIRFSSLGGKNKQFRYLAVLRGHNGLVAKGALACLLPEHVEATSFAIQLLAFFIILFEV